VGQLHAGQYELGSRDRSVSKILGVFSIYRNANNIGIKLLWTASKADTQAERQVLTSLKRVPEVEVG
jgi:hypothetical protein